MILIGLDLGTTSTKACAFRPDGEMIAKCSAAYELRSTDDGAAVQSAPDILAAAETALTNVVRELDEAPAAIGISCAMHGVLLLDEDFEPLAPVMTYADVRGQAVMDDFDEATRHDLLEHTGTPVHPMSPLVKLRWLRTTENGEFTAAAHLGDLKSYLVSQWTQGGFLLDQQLASATGLWSARAGDWYEPALELALDDTATDRLPKIVDPRTPLEWKPAVADRIGVAGVPLVIGGSDGCLANLGSNLMEHGKVAVTVGTSAAVRVTHRGTLDPEEDTHTLFDYVLYDDYRVLGGATNNGGKVLEWANDLFGGRFDSIGDMVSEALAAEDNDIAFEPFLYGERAPVWDATATATFSGLRGRHGPVDLARAIVMGLTDNICRILGQLEAASGPADTLYVSGGITQSPDWIELLEKRTGRPTKIVETVEASAFGAALIAKMALR